MSGSSNSGIYWGSVRHRRFSPVSHEFHYRLYMLGIDLDELDAITNLSKVFGTKWFNPLRFNEKDYVKSEPGALKQRILSKVKQLGGDWSEDNKVIMLLSADVLDSTLAQSIVTSVMTRTMSVDICLQK